MRMLCCFVLLVALTSSGRAATEPDALQPSPGAVEAWQDMRFGMFICWGPVSLKGTEIGWSRGKQIPVEEYDNLYKQWNPRHFDAGEWARVVKETGAKYVVFLTKHHDGFCLWDTKETDYNVMNSPFGRDVTGELAKALREQGVAFFPYYSTCDWYHPDFPVTSPGGKTKRPTHNIERYTRFLEAQSKELITRYGPLLGIWYDVPQCFDRARGERVIRYVRSLQPSLVVNNRTGAPGDFDTPEQHVGRFNVNRPWESCITLGTQWAWKPNDTLKPYTDAIRMLICCAAGNGNLALNTNPMPDGRIEPRQVRSFKKIGEWLEQYGESVYGTRGGPFLAPDTNARKFGSARHRFGLPAGRWWGGSTHKGNTVYLHILRWPDDAIRLAPIPAKILGHRLLTGGTASVNQADDGITITVPAEHRQELDTIIELTLDTPAAGLRPGVVPSGSLSAGRKATASSTWPGHQHTPQMAFDDDPATRWGAGENTKAGWLAIDLGEPKTFGRLCVNEGDWDRVRKFELQVRKGDEWRTIHAGTTIGESFSAAFEPVTAQQVRLNILEATNVPTIWEFRVFAK